MTDGSFLFARFDDRRKLTEVEEILRPMVSVIRWDAVDGFYGLAVRFGTGSEADIKKLKSMDGVTESVESPVSSESTPRAADNDLCRAYVLIEAAPQQVGPLAEAVEKFEETQYLGRTEGRFGLVAVLQSGSFDAIDSAIEDKISTLDGVLRLKEGRIISSHVK